MSFFANEKEFVMYTLSHLNKNIKDIDGNTILHRLCNSNSDKFDLIKYCLSNGMDKFINVKNNSGQTALALYIINDEIKIKSERIINLFINNIDKNVITNHGNTYLHLVCNHYYNIEIIKLLLSKGINVNKKNNKGKTCLHLVKDKNTLKLLIDNDGDINVKNNNGLTCLHSVCDNNVLNLKMIKLLIECGIDINEKTNKGNTCLHIICYKKVIRPKIVNIIELLIENGININERNNIGNTCLNLICKESRNFDVIKLLVKNGADVNISNNYFNSPLHNIMYDDSNKQIIKFLIDHDANIFKINNKEINILDIAKDNTEINYFVRRNYQEKILNNLLNKDIVNLILNYICDQ